MGTPVQVGVFTRPESTGYLARRTGLDYDACADAVAKEVGDLPLADTEPMTKLHIIIATQEARHLGLVRFPWW